MLLHNYPKVVVGCFIRNQKGEILLVKSYKWPGLWVVMGGHIELGERIADTVARETKEELGMEVEFDRVIEVVEFINDPAFHQSKHFVALQCECHVVGGDKPTIDNDEIQEARWFSLDDAQLLPNLLPETQKTIRKIYLQNSDTII